MGELEEVKELLKTTLSSITANMEIQNAMISQLQAENRELKEMIKNKNHATNPLQAEVMSKFKRNKKLLIKNKILEVIKSKELSIPELKEIVVDQFNYCSKASFYRYVEELKHHDFIHIGNNIVKIKPMVEVV